MEVPGDWSNVENWYDMMLLTRGYKRRNKDRHQEELLFSGLEMAIFPVGTSLNRKPSSMHLTSNLVNAFGTSLTLRVSSTHLTCTLVNAFDIY